MYGHVETPGHWIRHMDLLRDIQKDTGGFTEFVPLSLIYQEAPMYRQGLVPGVRQGATGIEVIKMHALARLFLGPTFRNIQSSWVKEGPKLAQVLLVAGANDLGGTLINESISTSAGAGYGQLVPPAELRRLVREAGRVPAQRDHGVRADPGVRAPRGRRGLAARPHRRRRGALRLLQGARRLRTLPLSPSLRRRPRRSRDRPSALLSTGQA